MATSRNGTAKWVGVILAGIVIVGGAAGAHSKALEKIKINADQIAELRSIAASIRTIEHALLKLAAHSGVDVTLD